MLFSVNALESFWNILFVCHQERTVSHLRKLLLYGVGILFALASIPTSAQFQRSGTATAISCDCYRLTQSTGAQNGSIWNQQRIDLGNSFDYNFTVMFGCSDAGADGVVFALQTNPLASGVSGGGIGYQTISPSLAVEFDTYQNGWDPTYDHIAVISNGDVDHTTANNLAGPVAALASSGNIEDCLYHDVRIQWTSATNTLNIWLDGSLRLSYTGNIVANLFGGNAQVYWGFTSSTGGSVNEHVVCMSRNADFSASATDLCLGEDLQLTDLSVSSLNRITSRSWDFGDGTTSIALNPTHTYTTAGNYTVTLTISDPSGCIATATRTVQVHALPVLSVPVDSTICSGSTLRLNVSGAQQYDWAPAAGLSATSGANVDATPSVATTYTITGTDANGCSSSGTVNVGLAPVPNLQTSGDVAYCDGGSAQLSASGASVYDWSPVTGLDDPTIATPLASPLTTTVYTVNASIGYCTATATLTVTVDPVPVVSVSGNAILCLGASTSLNASGATSYSWSPANGLSASSGASVNATPVSSIVYTITGSTAAGCTDDTTFSITVHPVPAISVRPDTTVCEGVSLELWVTGTDTYRWTPGAGLSSVTDSVTNLSATASTVYTVSGTNTFGCSTTATTSITVNPLPVLQTMANVTICEGDVTALNTGGAATFSWSPLTGLSAGSGSSVNASPALSTQYTVTGSTLGCTASTTVQVNVNPLPILTVTSPVIICITQSATLNASGAASYSWSPAGSLNSGVGASVVATPASTTTYTVTGTTNGCSSSATIPVTVAPALNVQITPANPVICAGESITLSAQGAANYTWTPAPGLGSVSGPVVTAQPAGTTTYSVTGSSGVCTDDAVVTVQVTPLPVVTIDPVLPICTGQSATLQAQGATSYQWLPDPALASTSGATVNASPATTQTFTVVGTQSGCNDTAQATIVVHALPVVSVAGEDSICSGFSTTLLASGGIAYQWSPVAGLDTAQGIQVQAGPSTLTVYTVTGTDANGCSNTSTHTVDVLPLPVLSVSPGTTICAGDTTVLQVSGASTYNWRPTNGLSSANGSTINASPAASTVYTVSGYLTGCRTDATVSVNVTPLPVLVLQTDTTICYGDAATLVVSGATSYQWSPAIALNTTSGGTVVANPVADQVYTVTGSAQGCSSTASTQVHVTPLPVITVQPVTAVCSGTTVTLQAQGATTYTWSPTAGLLNTSGASVQARPDVTTYYTVTGTSLGCSSSASIFLEVFPTPVVNFLPNPVSGCAPLQVRFFDLSTAEAGSHYQWTYNGITDTSRHPELSFPDAGTYSVRLEVTTPHGCSSYFEAEAVTVDPLPVADFNVSTEETTILTPVIRLTDASSDASAWAWDFGDAAGISSDQDPVYTYADTGTYVIRLIALSPHGCRDTAYARVRVNEDYALYVPNTFTPNGDGKNELFYAYGIGVHAFELLVFDRWGKVIFRSDSLQQGWNGNYQGGESLCPEGVYVYKIRAQDPKGEWREASGNVNLIR